MLLCLCWRKYCLVSEFCLAVSESVSSEYDHNFWSGNFRLLQEVSGGFSSPGVEGRSFRCLISRIPDLQSPGALSTQLYVSFYELLCQCACLRERRSWRENGDRKWGELSHKSLLHSVSISSSGTKNRVFVSERHRLLQTDSVHLKEDTMMNVVVNLHCSDPCWYHVISKWEWKHL